MHKLVGRRWGIEAGKVAGVLAFRMHYVTRTERVSEKMGWTCDKLTLGQAKSEYEQTV
jgi:hypothetical protein